MSGPIVPLADRFWPKVQKTPTCWLWTGGRSSGYGMIRVRSAAGWKQIGAHRVSWELHFGPIPKGLHVLHRCDVRCCVNAPEHLFLGTAADNMADAATKGRMAHGSRNSGAKLTEAQVLAICQRVLAGEKQKEIAVEFGICESHLSEIVNGKLWRHVTSGLVLPPSPRG